MTAAELDAFETSQAAHLARFDAGTEAVIAAANAGDKDALVAAIKEVTEAAAALRAGQHAIISHMESL